MLCACDLLEHWENAQICLWSMNQCMLEFSFMAAHIYLFIYFLASSKAKLGLCLVCVSVVHHLAGDSQTHTYSRHSSLTANWVYMPWAERWWETLGPTLQFFLFKKPFLREKILIAIPFHEDFSWWQILYSSYAGSSNLIRTAFPDRWWSVVQQHWDFSPFLALCMSLCILDRLSVHAYYADDKMFAFCTVCIP